MDIQTIITILILSMVLCMFIFMFVLMALSITRWHRAAVYHPPPIKIEEYTCPKCGSKELELVGRRTLRCRKCGTTFTIGVETEGRWIVWPFWPIFWWIPITWPIPVKENALARNFWLAR